ncbi:GNAT family N-acetyltransferase [Chitiniphilus purpureus]|uniref:GNAT family N-acetyltransferase n=1 Tax=Chitiniphilus purpureus TaxID=2981137 RepID=A0ABY6DNN1_9NEIS|nr:GNAT family N-acetyltransferase [Chitiniphilus sp. CD1]UXY15984.1 GNAT family N-acetyltransferase [Chitiniphilus sp. CD1]
MSDTQLRVHPRIDDLPADQWNALAGAHPAQRHAFLAALEASGAVGPGTGWQPCHLGLWRDGRLCAAMPLYAKTHSFGEYVFDWAWARAYAEHGLAYYPKLVCAIPFTPVPGARLFAGSAQDRLLLLNAARERAGQDGLSSLHLLFADNEDLAAAQAMGMLRREQVQFHWLRQPHWRDFDDFLASLARDKRKRIRQERRRVAQAGVAIERKRGSQIDAMDWAFFIRCYEATYRQHRSTPYLNLAFFRAAHTAAPDDWLMVQASRDGVPIAAALNLVGPDRLYGRYWGAQWDAGGWVPGLHFELCYYQGIEFALAEGLAAFEGGAQGEHKLARGFSPVITYSAHWLAHPAFADAVDRFLGQERQAVSAYRQELEMHLPFRDPLIST